MKIYYKQICIGLLFVLICILVFWVLVYFEVNKFLTGLLGATVCFSFGWYSSILARKTDIHERILPYEEWEDEPSLYTFNGVGTTMFGVSSFHFIKYNFFSIWFIPIFPLNCYVCEYTGESNFDHAVIAFHSEDSISIYNCAKWNVYEIFSIYLKRWGLLFSFVSCAF